MTRSARPSFNARGEHRFRCAGPHPRAAQGCRSARPRALIGVLLMAHGTPDSIDEMPEYLTRVRGGRLPSAELVEEMRQHYAAIGGRSPLTDITCAQGRALEARLGPTYRVLVGMRNWRPFIEDVLASETDGLSRILGIPLAPQFSTLSVGKYLDAAARAIPGGITFECVPSFHDHPMLVDAFAQRVLQARPEPDEEIVFTAHSLPERVVTAGDPYPTEVARTAALVAAGSGIERHALAYQSAGRTPEPWLGPDLSEHVRARAAAGARAVLVVPIGFVCDHTEILYDIDVDAAAAARESGVGLRRTESLNTLPRFIDLLVDLVVSSGVRH